MNTAKFTLTCALSATLAAGAATLDTNAFRHSCTVTFPGYSGSSTLTGFPALVRIPQGSPIYSAARPDGSDIRFADAGGNLVPHEIDIWNTAGESLIWVKVPSLSGTATMVTLHCGGIVGAIPEVNPRETWAEAGYKGVWHFSGSNADSSPNNLVGTASATPPTYSTAGKVGTAFAASGVSYFDVANDAKWAGYDGNALTVSAWVKTDALATFGRIVSCRGTSYSSRGFELQMQGNSTRFNAVAADGSGTVTQDAPYISPLNANTDYVYLTAVYANGTVQLYANGSKVGDPMNGVAPGTPDQVLRIGGAATTTAYNWNGSLDEVRFQWAAQSADWVAADFATQKDAAFAVLGELTDNAALKVDEKAFRKKCPVTFSGYAGSSTLEDFPALVRIPSSSAIAGSCGRMGEKMCFADADGFIVPHEIDTWTTSGESLVWVRVPRLAGTATTLTLYAGAVPANAASPRLVWSGANYKGVWHFSGSNADSSPNNLVGTASATPPTYSTAGKVGTAFAASGVSYFDVANDAKWAGYDGNALTVSAWVKTDVASGYGRVISCKGHSDNYSPGFELSMQNEANLFNAIAGNGTARSQNVQYIKPLSSASGHVYLTAVYQDGSILLYANGSYVGRRDDSIAPGLSQTPLRIGGTATTTANNWNGSLDEVRFQWAAQSADWVAADFATQNDAGFAVLGASEPLNGATTVVFR